MQGLFHANQVAAFDYSERHDALASRVTNCVSKAFEAIGASHATQEVIFWNLFVTKGVGRKEIMDKPSEFLEGVKDIYGDAGLVVFEYKLALEIAREFGLAYALDEEQKKQRNTSDIVRLIARVAVESPGGVREAADEPKRAAGSESTTRRG